MKVKVLHLGSPTGLYGAERWILALIKHLDPSKIETFVGVIHDDPALEAPLLKEATKLGFTTFAIKAYGRFNLKAIFGLRDLLRTQKIDILHTHGYKQDLVGFLATRGLPTKIIATPHGWSKEPDLKLTLYETINRLVFYGLDRVVPLSRELMEGLSRLPGLRRKLLLIENAVDLDEIAKVESWPEEIEEKRRAGFLIAGYIGQLIHRKGLDILLKALAQPGLQDVFLFVVGEGPLRAELEKLTQKLGLSERVRFTGFRPDRLNYLKGFDLFVLPSRLEGIPRCLMEAMGMGKAVVASDISGIRELIPRDGKGGLLFPVNDHLALSKQLIRLKEEALRRSLGEEAREIVKQRFSAARMAKDYEKLYQEIAANISWR